MGPTQNNEKENSMKGKAFAQLGKAIKKKISLRMRKKKNFANEDTHKKFISETCKQLLQCNIKKYKPNNLMEK